VTRAPRAVPRWRLVLWIVAGSLVVAGCSSLIGVPGVPYVADAGADVSADVGVPGDGEGEDALTPEDSGSPDAPGTD
jgi:hypothetical protein